MWVQQLSLFAILVSAAALVSPSPANLEKRAVHFAADASINARGIFNAAKASAAKGKSILATFPSATGPKVHIFGDWLNLKGVSAFHWIADMQVDCDGVDFKCKGNQDGQPQTSFGHLDARKVPFFVIPEQFFQQQKGKIKPNAVGAVVCNNRMFHAIFADTNGDTPETIGEASELLAQTCFPNDGLNGGKGHDSRDVLYITFGQQAPSGVGDKSINIPALKALGDAQAKKLASALGV